VTGPGIGLDEEQSGALIDHALELGVTALDSADIYCGGASERIIGAWHARHPDADVVITTKTGFTKDGPNLQPDRLRSQIDKSRKILGRIDLFLPHTVDPNTPWPESLPVLSDAVDQGLIRAYGLSNVTEEDLSNALETADSIGIRRPQLIQNRYSLIAKNDDVGVLPIARAESISYTPYSPLAAGLLAGRYINGEQAEHGSRLSTQVPRRALCRRHRRDRRIPPRPDRIAAGIAVNIVGIGLGTAPFAFRDGTAEDAIATVHAALDAGVGLIDTALAYTRLGVESYAEHVVA
jgi:aryl-alcohol dehydrogenase-like predicted oxidoreductase